MFCEEATILFHPKEALSTEGIHLVTDFFIYLGVGSENIIL